MSKELEDIDAEIRGLEMALANANERRREIINRTDANKCEHNYRLITWGSGLRQCTKCNHIKDL